MKITRKKIIILSLIIILSISGYFWNKNKQVKIETEKKAKLVYTVNKGDIKTEVKVTATAKLANEQNLSFGQEGKITNVFVKVGDEVKAGTVLAELSMDDYQNTIQNAKLELENSKLGLTKLLNNDISLRKSQLESQIHNTKVSYNIELEQIDILENGLNNNLKQKEEQLEQLAIDYKLAEKNLEIAKSSLEINSKIETEQTYDSLTARKQTINGVINSLNSSLGDIETIVESVDEIFGVSKIFKDKIEYNDYLGAKDYLLKNKINSNINDGYDFINIYNEKINNINSNMSDDEIYNIIQDYYNDSEILIEMCDNAVNSIGQSIESVGTLTDTMISGFKSTISSSRTSSVSLRTQLQSYSTSINSLLSNANQIDQLVISLEQKELNYEIQENTLEEQKENIKLLINEIKNLKQDNINQVNRKKSQNTSLLESIDLLKKELKELLDGPDEYDIKQQRNLIKQAQLRLEKAIDSKDNYQIIAEFDGRIRSNEIIEGEQYKLEDRKYIVIENPNLIELELQVNQIDIVKIKKDDIAIITFDAYPNNSITASITDRNVNPISNGRGGIYYKVSIILEKQELEILAGMTGIVNVITAKANDVVIIPSLALIQGAENTTYVYKKEGFEYKLHKIETGIINNFQVEVTDGLKQGDQIKGSVLDEKALEEMGIDDASAKIF